MTEIPQLETLSADYFIIICDDVSYSGCQLCEHFHPIHHPIAAPVYLNLVGLVSDAKCRIERKCQQGHVHVTFPKHVLYIETMSFAQFFAKEARLHGMDVDSYATLCNCYFLHSNMKLGYIDLLKHYTVSSHMDPNGNTWDASSFVYTFQKFPDIISTFPFCKIAVPHKNTLAIEITEFANTYDIVLDLMLEYLSDSEVQFHLNNHDLLLKRVFSHFEVETPVSNIQTRFPNHIPWAKRIEPIRNMSIHHSALTSQPFIATINNGDYEDFVQCEEVIVPFYKQLNYVFHGQRFSSKKFIRWTEDGLSDGSSSDSRSSSGGKRRKQKTHRKPTSSRQQRKTKRTGG